MAMAAMMAMIAITIISSIRVKPCCLRDIASPGVRGWLEAPGAHQGRTGGRASRWVAPGLSGEAYRPSPSSRRWGPVSPASARNPLRSRRPIGRASGRVSRPSRAPCLGLSARSRPPRPSRRLRPQAAGGRIQASPGLRRWEPGRHRVLRAPAPRAPVRAAAEATDRRASRAPSAQRARRLRGGLAPGTSHAVATERPRASPRASGRGEPALSATTPLRAPPSAPAALDARDRRPETRAPRRARLRAVEQRDRAVRIAACTRTSAHSSEQRAAVARRQVERVARHEPRGAIACGRPRRGQDAAHALRPAPQRDRQLRIGGTRRRARASASRRRRVRRSTDAEPVERAPSGSEASCAFSVAAAPGAGRRRGGGRDRAVRGAIARHGTRTAPAREARPRGRRRVATARAASCFCSSKIGRKTARRSCRP